MNKEDRIGFIGIGAMGIRMVKKLIADGFKLNIYNRTKIKKSLFNDNKIKIFEDLKELYSNSKIIIIMVTDDIAISEIIYNGKKKIKPQAGSIIINTSTISPSLSDKLNRDLNDNGIEYVDAPVLGSLPAAEKGSLKFLLKLNKTPLNKIKDLIQSLGSDYRIIIKSKTAQEIKLFHNTLCAIVIVSVSKFLISSSKFQTDGKEVYESFKFGALNCDLIKAKQKMFSDLIFEPLFPLKLMYKDINTLIIDLEKSNIYDSLINSVRDDYKNALSEFGDLDCASIYKYFSDYNDK